MLEDVQKNTGKYSMYKTHKPAEERRKNTFKWMLICMDNLLGEEREEMRIQPKRLLIKSHPTKLKLLHCGFDSY